MEKNKNKIIISTTVIKNSLSNLLRFVICNLIAFGVGVFVLLLLSKVLFAELAENRVWTDFAFDLSMSLGMIIPFVPLYFLKNNEYKRHYLKSRENGHTNKEIVREHVRSFAKYEIWLLLAISLVFSFIPFANLGKIGLGFMFSSASFFADFLPNYILHNSSFVFRLLGWLLWDGYIVGLYFICLKISYSVWERSKLRKFENENRN